MNQHPDQENAREWQAQEQAMHDERSNISVATNPLVADYRQLMRVLRQPPPEVPTDFATQVASLAGRSVTAREIGFELMLLRALYLVLALSSAFTVARYGSDWLRGMSTLWPQSPAAVSFAMLDWTLALALCLGLSWSVERWRSHWRGSQG